METHTTHAHLAALARVAQMPRLTPRWVDMLHTLGGRIWRVHRSDPSKAWLWGFHSNGCNGYTSDDGWDAPEILRAFAVLDCTTNINGELEPNFYSFRTPVLTEKAMQTISGVRTTGTWISGAPGCTGFLFDKGI